MNEFLRSPACDDPQIEIDTIPSNVLRWYHTYKVVDIHHRTIICYSNDEIRAQRSYDL
jgi:hypothetical protein